MSRLACVAFCFILSAGPALAGDPGGSSRADAILARVTEWPFPDAGRCRFFEVQASGRATGDFSMDVVFACREIAARLSEGWQLGDALTATALSLRDYRQVMFDRYARPEVNRFGASETERLEVAETTGLAAAIDAIQQGF